MKDTTAFSLCIRRIDESSDDVFKFVLVEKNASTGMWHVDKATSSSGSTLEEAVEHTLCTLDLPACEAVPRPDQK